MLTASERGQTEPGTFRRLVGVSRSPDSSPTRTARAVYVRRRGEQRQVLRERLASEAAGHRQEADAHATKAQELGPEAEALRREATEHAVSAEREAARAEELGTRATQAEQQTSREGQSAGRHDEKAAELEEKL